MPESAYILYVDHSGHVAPLSSCYHATASRRLSSSLDDRLPSSTITEVDSAFCPQCLTFHDAGTASNLGFCPKASCRRCPNCQSIASLAFEDKKCFYVCGYCGWTSKKGGLVVDVASASDGSISKESMAKATEQMKSLLELKSGKGNDASLKNYKERIESLDDLAKEKVRRKNHPTLIPAPVNKKSSTPWSIEILEEAMLSKRQEKTMATTPPIGATQAASLDASLRTNSIESILMQSTLIQSHTDLLPLPVQLRPRKSRRCRAELAEGRPGILVKPKLNPLEGDTSLRTGHGQWWKKDASAVQVIPRVTVAKQQHQGRQHSFLLKISNPTLGTVKLRLAASNYQGEPTEDGVTKKLTNILVDSLRRTRVDATLRETAAPESGWIALDSVDDTYMDLGRSEISQDAEQWSPRESTNNHTKLVASKGDAAWVEFVIVQELADDVPAVPLSLQIQVGNGSWESSLVKAKGTNDFVAFDMVLLWTR